jgi:hypothetical protein
MSFGSECDQHRGVHAYEDLFYFEVVDGDDRLRARLTAAGVARSVPLRIQVRERIERDPTRMGELKVVQSNVGPPPPEQSP